MPQPVWIFGYGSLMWRPGFDFVERRVAAVRGWVRRFYQGSVDHRGVPGAPGRVVTLVAEPGSSCWGLAFRLQIADQEAIVAALDRREQGGYQQLRLPLYSVEGACFAEGLTYIGGPKNPCFLGPAPVAAIAAQIRSARGPSGENTDYARRLAATLRELGLADPHVLAVVAELG